MIETTKKEKLGRMDGKNRHNEVARAELDISMDSIVMHDTIRVKDMSTEKARFTESLWEQLELQFRPCLLTACSSNTSLKRIKKKKTH